MQFFITFLICFGFEAQAFHREETIKAQITIADSELDVVGKQFKNRKADEWLLAHCTKRNEKNLCKRAVYILKTEGRNLVVHDHASKKVVVLLDSVLHDDFHEFKQDLRKSLRNDHQFDLLGLPFFITVASLSGLGPAGLLLLPITFPLDLVALIPVVGGHHLVTNILNSRIANQEAAILKEEKEGVHRVSTKQFNQLIESLESSPYY